MNHTEKYGLVKQANKLLKYLAAIGGLAPSHALGGAGIGGLGNLIIGDKDTEAWDRLLRGAAVGGGAGAAASVPTGIMAVKTLEKAIEQNKLIKTLKVITEAQAKGRGRLDDVRNLF